MAESSLVHSGRIVHSDRSYISRMNARPLLLEHSAVMSSELHPSSPGAACFLKDEAAGRSMPDVGSMRSLALIAEAALALYSGTRH